MFALSIHAFIALRPSSNAFSLNSAFARDISVLLQLPQYILGLFNGCPNLASDTLK
ncbi:MAG: hypothetical protein M2R45_04527 [Verrucomicrobia subdivision 3 bacterium]|nr:hypothetical protein [Limisphaerales bacterium]MCS1416834.1 hypothetical protein [Limisphaerales bacterium]